MDDYDFGDWGNEFSTDTDQFNFDSGNFDNQIPTQDMNFTPSWSDFSSNLSNTPAENWMNSGTDWNQVDQQTSANFSSPMTDAVGSLGKLGGGLQDTLSRLFTNPQTLLKGLGALFEGSQNKKYASKLNNAANQVQQISDPFGPQRAQYQNLLSQSYTDPNVVLGRPEIAGQLANMKQQLERRDAAAGRRSQYGDREAQLVLQGSGLIDKYRQGLVPLTGANMQPNTAALAQLFSQAAKPATQGYVSPLLNAAGNISTTDRINALLDSLKG